MRRHCPSIVLSLLLLVSSAAAAAPGVDARALDENMQQLKQEVIELNRDMMLLEEDLLFPASTRVVVFVSTDAGQLFELGSVQLRIDDQVVANHIYEPHQREALAKGGMHRLYLGNLKRGEHELVAYFTGKDSHGRTWRRAADATVDKAGEPATLELRVVDVRPRLGPEFTVKEWKTP